ncbi:hypothetical protein Tco_1456289 [Tanacetum coccineum]
MQHQTSREPALWSLFVPIAPAVPSSEAKVTKSGKKKQPDEGLETLSEIALTEAKQMKIAIKRSKTQFHSSHASGSGADEGTDVSPGVPDVPTYGYEDEQISWKSSDEDDNEEVSIKTQGTNVEGEDMDEEETNEEEEVNELYRDVSVNMKGRDTEMTNASQTNVQGFISNMLNPNLDTGIDSILNLNTKSTTLIDVPVTSNSKMPPSSATTPPPPPIPPIQPLQQTPVPTPTIVPSTSLQDLPNFGSLFKFEDRVKALEDDFSKFKQTNQFAAAVSLIPDIVDTYLANKMNEAVKTTVQLQSDRLRDEAQAENEDYINKLDDNIKKIIKEQVKAQVNEQVTKILPRIKKITFYKALVDTYGDTVTIKRRRDDQDEDEQPSAGSNRGFKRRRARKEPESTSAPKEKTSKSSGKSKEGSKYHNTSTSNNLAQKEDTRNSFNKMMDTPLDFSAFVMNRLKIDTLTPELFAGLTFELMKGSCKSLVELEYFLEEVCKATIDKLDWNNPEGQQYPHDLRKPLPLIPNSQGRHVIPFDHFINNDLAYLRGGSSSRTYATSVTKTKAADYGHVKWIEDLVPNTMWSPVPVIYNKHALWGISHRGRKHQQFYRFAVNRESARDVYSKHKIIAVTKLQIIEWHNYKHLDWITVRRNDDKLYTFKEGDYKRLRLQDIEDMLLLLKHCHPKACGRSLVRCRKLPKEAQPHKAEHNKDKKNKLMRIDELYKFSDGTLKDVQTALDDILKRIKMKYLPQTYWKKVDKDKARAMIQAIDKMLKNKRIMRSLEKFIGGRPYEGDFQLLQRTI